MNEPLCWTFFLSVQLEECFSSVAGLHCLSSPYAVPIADLEYTHCCQSGLNAPWLNGNYWVYVGVKVLAEAINLGRRMESHGSLLFDLSLTPEAPLNETPQIDRSNPLPRPLLTRSANPSLNVRRHNVYGLT